MKKCFILFALFLMMSFTQISFAQDENEVKVGLGIEAINAYNYSVYYHPVNYHCPKIYLTINLNNNFRIEPILGFTKAKQEVDDDEINARIIHLGVGVFKILPYENFNMYMGGRFAMTFSKSIEETYNYYGDSGTDEISQKDWEFSPSIGGEYFFNEHFSFGGECSFKFISYGIPKVKGVSDKVYDKIDFSDTQMNLKPLVFVRWYF